MERFTRNMAQVVNPKTVKSVLALSASFVLNGVPPIVCESVIDDVVISVRKRTSRLLQHYKQF